MAPTEAPVDGRDVIREHVITAFVHIVATGAPCPIPAAGNARRRGDRGNRAEARCASADSNTSVTRNPSPERTRPRPLTGFPACRATAQPPSADPSAPFAPRLPGHRTPATVEAGRHAAASKHHHGPAKAGNCHASADPLSPNPVYNASGFDRSTLGSAPAKPAITLFFLRGHHHPQT